MATRKRIIAGSQVAATATTYYTCPANTKCVISAISFCNTTANAITVTLYLVASGGSASASNTITSARTLGPGETWSCPDVVNQVIEASGFIQALASSATSVTIIGSGVEFP